MRTPRVIRNLGAFCAQQFRMNFSKIVVGVVMAILGSIWVTASVVLNTELSFQLLPSSSGLVILTDPLANIERQSKRFCGGGWDRVLRVLALTSCRSIEFDPRAVLNLGICPSDRDKFAFSARDALHALLELQRRYKEDNCLLVTVNDINSYKIVPGPRSVRVTFEVGVEGTPGFLRTVHYFCGCSQATVAAVAADRGAVVK